MHSGRVLVVDDLPDVRSTLSGLLSDSGHEVRSVSSRAEALQLMDTERFHVAVLDVRLDESDEDNQDGLLLMEDIHRKWPSTAVIILTGYGTVDMVQKALQPNARRHLVGVWILAEVRVRPTARIRGIGFGARLAHKKTL